MNMLEGHDGAATFSVDRRHRFELWRRWGESRSFAMFIGLNPSTADERQDDPTVRRCINYAIAWGYEALCMTNIFSIRATDPRDMRADAMPSMPGNDDALLRLARQAGIVVAAWGAHGGHRNRGPLVRARLSTYRVPLYCLGETKEGHPKHPLYLRKDLEPVPYNDVARRIERSAPQTKPDAGMVGGGE